MSSRYIGIAAIKFKRLVDYLQRIDLDVQVIAKNAGLSLEAIQQASDESILSAYDYSKLF